MVPVPQDVPQVNAASLHSQNRSLGFIAESLKPNILKLLQQKRICVQGARQQQRVPRRELLLQGWGMFPSLRPRCGSAGLRGLHSPRSATWSCN